MAALAIPAALMLYTSCSKDDDIVDTPPLRPKTPLPQSPRTPTRMPAIVPRASGLSTKTGSVTTTAR